MLHRLSAFFLRRSLRNRLIIQFVGLVILSVGVVSWICLSQFQSFSEETISRTRDALTREAFNALNAGVRFDRQTIRRLIESAENDARRLAVSSDVKGYFTARSGDNELLNQLVENQAETAVESIYNICLIQQRLADKKLDIDLGVAEYVLNVDEGIDMTALMSEWRTVDPETRAEGSVSLPVLEIGFNAIGLGEETGLTRSVSDTITELTGSTAAVFQKMNENWDMIPISTSLRDENGKRMSGHFMKAATADGAPNPVIEAIRNDAVYRGRAKVMGEWFVGLFKPLKISTEEIKSSQTIQGMIFVGEKERNLTILRDAILKVRIGGSGYATLIDTQGRVILHPNGALVGKNILSDLGLSELETLQKDFRNPEGQIITYTFENREKFLAFRYFEPWGWIIAVTGYWDEFSQSEAALAILKNEMQNVAEGAVRQINGDTVSAYHAIRFISAVHDETIALTDGVFEVRRDAIAETLGGERLDRLKSGGTHYSGVYHRDGENLLTIVMPIFYGEMMAGAIAIDLKWRITWELLRNRVYGKSGYSYIINPEGVLISHPKYRLEDNVNISDSAFGDLATLVRDKMLRGEAGTGTYAFEDTRKCVSFLPLKIGDQSYAIAATSPVSEFFELVHRIEADARRIRNEEIYTILAIMMLLILVGLVLAVWAGNWLIGPINAIIRGLAVAAERVTRTSRQITDASHQLAEGTSEQASALQQTSAALEEMAATIRQNAESAARTHEMTRSSRDVVTSANYSMTRLVSAMNEITRAGEETSQIIKTSEEIAFQTNLLALNAAIEAARAGERGAGFAVVAEEVRRLALNAAAASRDTAEKIRNIVDQLQEGSGHVTTSNDAFSKVNTSAAEVAELIESIAAASAEQARGVDQLNKAVAEMDKVTHQNATNSQQSAAASDGLRAQAEEMKGFTDRLVCLIEGHRRAGRDEGLTCSLSSALPTRKF